MPRSAAVRLFPIDQLSRGVRAVIPAPYRSPMIRPFHVTTKAAVIAAAGWNAVSTAARIAAVSSAGANGSVGRRSPIGHACVDGSGRTLATRIGLELSELRPSGSVTQPWPPAYLAVRLTP